MKCNITEAEIWLLHDLVKDKMLDLAVKMSDLYSRVGDLDPSEHEVERLVLARSIGNVKIDYNAYDAIDEFLMQCVDRIREKKDGNDHD